MKNDPGVAISPRKNATPTAIQIQRQLSGSFTAGGYRCGAAESATIVVATGGPHRCGGVHGDAEVRVDLEVQVRNTDHVAGVADVADDIALCDHGRRPLVRRPGDT